MPRGVLSLTLAIGFGLAAANLAGGHTRIVVSLNNCVDLSGAQTKGLEADRGDGRAEHVFISRRRIRNGCAYDLIVDTRSQRLVKRIRQTVSEGEWPEPLVPRVIALAPIDGVPGAEIVVSVWHGAATGFAAVYTVRRGRVLRLAVPGPEVPGTFPYGGTVGGVFGIDCFRGARSGFVIARAAGSRGASSSDGFNLETRIYQIRRAAFFLVKKTTRAVGRLPRPFGVPPFESCAVAQARP